MSERASHTEGLRKVEYDAALIKAAPAMHEILHAMAFAKCREDFNAASDRIEAVLIQIERDADARPD